MENIPDEVKAIQEQFWVEEVAKRAAQEANKKLDPKRQARIDALLKKPNTSRQIESIAVKVFKCKVEGGNGRHGVHIVTPNNERIPLPRHGGGRTVANGTGRAILTRAMAS